MLSQYEAERQANRPTFLRPHLWLVPPHTSSLLSIHNYYNLSLAGRLVEHETDKGSSQSLTES